LALVTDPGRIVMMIVGADRRKCNTTHHEPTMFTVIRATAMSRSGPRWPDPKHLLNSPIGTPTEIGRDLEEVFRSEAAIPRLAGILHGVA